MFSVICFKEGRCFCHCGWDEENLSFIPWSDVRGTAPSGMTRKSGLHVTLRQLFILFILLENEHHLGLLRWFVIVLIRLKASKSQACQAERESTGFLQIYSNSNYWPLFSYTRMSGRYVTKLKCLAGASVLASILQKTSFPGFMWDHKSKVQLHPAMPFS